MDRRRQRPGLVTRVRWMTWQSIDLLLPGAFEVFWSMKAMLQRRSVKTLSFNWTAMEKRPRCLSALVVKSGR